MDGKTAVFLPMTGVGVGVGHVARCLALAEALASERWRCVLALGAGASFPSSCSPDIETVKHERNSSWGLDELTERWPRGVDLAVIDRYDVDGHFVRALADWARQRLIIDDLLEQTHDCEFLLCTAPPPSAQKLAPHRPGEFLVGPPYALLRHEFWTRRVQHLLSQRRSKDRKTVVVSLGGSSQVEALSIILDGLASLSCPLRLKLVGPDAKAIARAFDKPAAGLKIETIPSCSDMSKLLSEADIAIGACGVSAWERAALGVPSIALEIAPNQHHVGNVLRQSGASIVLRGPEKLTAAAFAKAAGELLNDPDLSHAMGQRAERLVDALGARRTLLHIAIERSKDSRPVLLRPATEADRTIMYNWQQAPETRRYANNPRSPTFDEHKAWLTSRLQDPRCLLSVVRCGSEDAGVLRVDLTKCSGRPAGIVSIYLAPGAVGGGIGTAALRAARRLVPDLPLYAEIDPRNVASLAAFAKAGFQQVDGRWHTMDAPPAHN